MISCLGVEVFCRLNHLRKAQVGPLEQAQCLLRVCSSETIFQNVADGNVKQRRTSTIPLSGIIDGILHGCVSLKMPQISFILQWRFQSVVFFCWAAVLKSTNSLFSVYQITYLQFKYLCTSFWSLVISITYKMFLKWSSSHSWLSCNKHLLREHEIYQPF